MKSFAVLLLFVVLAKGNVFFQQEWENWKSFYEKTYTIEEEEKRQYIWQQNLIYITKHNLEADQGLHTYRLGANNFADLDNDEWRELILSQVTRPKSQMSFCNMTLSADSGYTVSKKNVDWRKKGYVTGVKNQKACGSCWSFSATGSLEGQHFKKTGQLVSLSEQNLIDCSTKEGNHGCEGGLMDLAFEYIKINGGIDTEASYPYMAKNDPKCLYNTRNKAATLTGCVDIARGSEAALMKAVEKVGPISVAIDAGHPSFQLYKSGVYYEPSCSAVKLDHGVLAVGFGVEEGKDYWLVKNSWGTVWGMEGYLMMSRNRNNNCGIATQASYPVV
ncbi:unnamed protein product [Clavelina lepadiformis]|uniref:Cathepsin L n=1 Tax=Clavelina lepadiformis TaxID=159417 RepID=A0ABP0GEC2_CLALP